MDGKLAWGEFESNSDEAGGELIWMKKSQMKVVEVQKTMFLYRFCCKKYIMADDVVKQGWMVSKNVCCCKKYSKIIIQKT